MSERHTPLRLVRVDADATVASLAEASGMHPALFLAMNTGKDPAGMFPGQELSELILSYNVPLPRGRVSPHIVPALAEAAAPAPEQPTPAAAGGAADGTGRASKLIHDQRYGAARGGPRKRKRTGIEVSQAPPTHTMQPLPSVNPTSVSGDKCAKVDYETQQETAIDWNAVIGGDESCLLGNASATKDTVVRAGSKYKVHRQSEFLHGTLNLDLHRCNSLITAIHACWLPTGRELLT
jgi:hypothetical protein